MNTNEVRKTDMFMIPLDRIEANQADNGRFAPRGDIQSLADKIREFGQLQPVGVKRLKGDQFKLVYGFGRYEAIKLLNQDQPEDMQLPIKAVIVKLNDREQFLANLAENMERESLSPMCNALNLRRLTENWGFTQAECAAKFGKSQGWVSQHLSLLNLTFDTQELVHSGMITFSDAVAMASKMDDNEQRQVVAAINVAKIEAKADANPTAKPEEVKKKAEKAAKAAGKEVINKATKPPSKPAEKKVNELGRRTYNEMKDLFMILTDSNQFSKEVRTTAAILLDGMDGKIREDDELIRMIVASIDRPKMSNQGAA